MLVYVAVLSCGVTGCARSEPEQPVKYYIDYSAGDDRASGRSKAMAWRHAPGDENAKGVAARTALRPGDALLFASGVRYRGELKLKWSGTPTAPITITSDVGGRAIFDGSDPAVGVRPCLSSTDCGGSHFWRRLSKIEFGGVKAPNVALFTSMGPLFPAQAPNVSDIFYSDNVQDYFEVSGADLSAGFAVLPKYVSELLGGPVRANLALWVYGNQVVLRPITSINGNVAHFDPTGLRFYDNRLSRIAVLGHQNLIDRPGEFSLVEGGRAAVAYLPKNYGFVSTGSGRGGVNLNGVSNISISNVSFENMADDGINIDSGISIRNRLAGASSIHIGNNRFENFRMPKGQGVITLRNVEGLSIQGNLVQRVALGSGFRITRSSDVDISKNDIRKIGRTAIMLMDVNRAKVSANVIDDVRGVHGNGLSVYLGNRSIDVIRNTISGAYRPMTFHGDGHPESANNISIQDNIFVGVVGSSAALSSWGNATSGVDIQRNLLLGGTVGLLLSPEDVDVTVHGNALNGISYKGGYPPSWKIGSNTEIAYWPGGDGHEFEAQLKELISGKASPAVRREICRLLGQSASDALGRESHHRFTGAHLGCDSEGLVGQSDAP